jgi:hypothetical protein
MSIKIITENGRAGLSFACDKCGTAIQPSEGEMLWDSDPAQASPDAPNEGVVACHHCAPTYKKAFTQPLEQALVFLLAKAGWLDAAFKPSNKLDEAAKVAYKLAQF